MNTQLHGVLRESSVAQRSRSPLHLHRLLMAGCMLFVVLSVLAACGGSSQGSAGGKTVITEMDYWSTEPANTVINKLFKQYEQAHPNVIIKRDAVVFGSLLPKADQEAASHTLPDLLELDNPDLANFAATGALTPLDSFMKGQYSSSDFFAGPLSTMTYNGKIYAFSVGNNDLALYYNKDMFNAAHLTPPTTWDQLAQDARLLTHGNTYGFAFSAAATEEGTWQFEPFLWSNNGSITQVNNAQGVQSLQFLTSLVQQGYASKAVLNWGQSDVTTQFEAGHAAMMEMGPWDLSLLNNQHINYGVVPFPVPSAGGKPVSPLGGEVWAIPATNPSSEQQATWDLVNWLEQPQQLLAFDQVNGYVPALKSVAQQLLQSNPSLSVFTTELNTARARTAQVGTKYPSISQAIWTAEQAALAGSMSPQAALNQAQQHINTIMQGS
jgi:multiple sugar transport system substrate-binding protein